MEKVKNDIKHIRNMVESLMMENRETSNIPSVPLDGLMDVIEMHTPRTGIVCDSKDCVFNIGLECGLKNVVLVEGKCDFYNPDLSFGDLVRGS